MTTNLPPRRKESRAPGTRIGVVKLGLFKRINCEVTDLSVSGAKLHSDDVSELPETFEISIRGTGKKRSYQCVKRWQDGNSIGVEFVTD